MSSEHTYTFKQPSERLITLMDFKPNHSIAFHRDGTQIGVLDFNGPEMVFTGDADESAKVFFDFIAKSFKARLEQERTDERNSWPAEMEAMERQVNILTDALAEQPAQRKHIALDDDFGRLIALARADEHASIMQLFTDPENQPTHHGTVTVEYMQREIAAERKACAKAGWLAADSGCDDKVLKAIMERGNT